MTELAGYRDVEWPAPRLEFAHVHNPFLCPAHVAGCECPALDDWLCNPYRMAGFCPDNIALMPAGR